MQPIILIGQLAATNADILSGTRLDVAPFTGVMTFRFAATVSLLGTNDFAVTLGLPGAEVPMDAQMAPLAVGNGNLDSRLAATMSFFIEKGGKVNFSAVKTGTTIMTYLVRFAPR